MKYPIQGCFPLGSGPFAREEAAIPSGRRANDTGAPDRNPAHSSSRFNALALGDDVLHLLAQCATDWEYWVDSQGNLAFVSPHCEAITGYKADRFLESPSLFLDIVHPDDRDLVMEHLHRSGTTEEAENHEPLRFRIVDRTGGVRLITHQCRPIYGKHGEFLGTQASNREVIRPSERERSPEDRECLYQTMVEDQTDPICRFKPDGELMFVNRAFRDCFGWQSGELIGDSFYQCLADEQREAVREKLALLRPDNPRFVYDQETVSTSGESRWHQWTFKGNFDAAGELVEVLSVARDITVCKMTEDALRDSEDRYRNLVNAIPDGVVAYDPDGRVTYLNDGFRRMYGWSKEELEEGSTVFVPPEELGCTLAAWQQTFAGEQVLLETRRNTKYGKVIDVQLRTAILRDQEGHTTESLVIHRDVTARNRAQLALQQAHDELERGVEERTRELAETNYKLRQEIEVRKKAEERLVESEYRNRALVENAPVGIMWCDTRGRIWQTNSKLLAILGLRSIYEEESINVFSHPPMVQSGIAEEIRRCAGSEEPVVYECLYLNDWGKSLWLRVHMVPTRDKNHRTNGVQAIVEDETLRRMAETALSESEERFRAVVETAKDCIFIKDKALVYTHVNPEFLRAVNLEKNRVLGKTDKDVFGAKDARYLMDLETRVLTEGRDVETTHYLTARGVHKTFDCIRVPLRTSNSEIIGICGIARDVTEREALEYRGPRTVGLYRSPVMETTLRQLLLAAESESIVLLLGESGSGKDFLAKYLHEHSHRAGGPFFAINCAALAASVAESELFGHEPGSFTGSRGRKRGLLEMAEGGTLLLNEIGELSLELQAKLLTFLDTQCFTRVGGEKTIRVNTRIVAATNRVLEQEVAAGRFREDLYYRLNVLAIRVPPLRERTEDIPFIAGDILEELSSKLGRSVAPGLDIAAMDYLCKHHWPGNVRELKNILERALILCRSDTVRPEDLTIGHGELPLSSNDKEIPVSISVSAEHTLNEALETAKRILIDKALQRSNQNVSAAARLLGVSRDALRYHIKALRIER